MIDPNQCLEIARGNPEAARFLEAYQLQCHWVDDLLDAPGPRLAGPLLAQTQAQWMLALAGNSWFGAHRAVLAPLMVLAAAAWDDANRMSASPDPRARRAADVVKGLWHEVFWMTAWLCGGWDHLCAMTAKYRQYDYDCKD